MKNSVVTIGNATLYLGDCREILPSLSADVVVTDPPWDQAKGIAGADNPRGLFSDVAPMLARSRLVAIQLGCYSDPCFCEPIANLMPFIHACWLRYVPPSYNGRVLVDADVAYIYGAPPSSQPGRRVLPSMCESTRRIDGEKEFLKSHGKNRTSAEAANSVARMSHPMPRHLNHVMWLVGWHSESSDVVCDPFLGSGTTGDACAQLNRKFIGIEIEEKFFDAACRRIDDAQRQGHLLAAE